MSEPVTIYLTNGHWIVCDPEDVSEFDDRVELKHADVFHDDGTPARVNASVTISKHAILYIVDGTGNEPS